MSRRLFALAFAALAGQAHAASLNIVAPNQQDLQSVAQDVVADFGYHAEATAESMGIAGFSVGGYGSISQVHDKDAFERLTGSRPPVLGIAGISLEKGIPYVGKVIGQYGFVPGTSAQTWAVGLQGTLLHEGLVLPSIASTVSFSGSGHVNYFGFHSHSIDVEVSKRFLFIAPFAGIGYEWGTVHPDAQFSLQNVDVDRTIGFAGARLSMLLVDLTAGWQRVGKDNVWNLRIGAGL